MESCSCTLPMWHGGNLSRAPRYLKKKDLRRSSCSQPCQSESESDESGSVSVSYSVSSLLLGSGAFACPGLGRASGAFACAALRGLAGLCRGTARWAGCCRGDHLATSFFTPGATSRLAGGGAGERDARASASAGGLLLLSAFVGVLLCRSNVSDDPRERRPAVGAPPVGESEAAAPPVGFDRREPSWVARVCRLPRGKPCITMAPSTFSILARNWPSLSSPYLTAPLAVSHSSVHSHPTPHRGGSGRSYAALRYSARRVKGIAVGCARGLYGSASLPFLHNLGDGDSPLQDREVLAHALLRVLLFPAWLHSVSELGGDNVNV